MLVHELRVSDWLYYWLASQPLHISYLSYFSYFSEVKIETVLKSRFSRAGL